MQTPHRIRIQWSDADRCYIAALPAFGAFAKTHGATRAQAMQNAKTVLSLLVDDTRAAGDAVTRPA